MTCHLILPKRLPDGLLPREAIGLPGRAYCIDVETWLTEPGVAAPPLVLGAISWLDPDGEVRGKLLTKDECVDALVAVLSDPTLVLINSNVAFDLLVIAVYAQRSRGLDLLPLIFAAAEAERLYDPLVARQLHDVANGTLNEDPDDGGIQRDPATGAKGRYSQSIVAHYDLGITDAKENDEFRLLYRELDGVPLEQLPTAAAQYPVDDVRVAHTIALAQCGHRPSRRRHDFQDGGPDKDKCRHCPARVGWDSGTDCYRLERHRNIHAVGSQTAAAWAMHLGAAWGLCVNQQTAEQIHAEVTAERKERGDRLVELGLLLPKKKKGVPYLGTDKARLARAVAVAYGATGSCAACAGTQKARSAKTGNPVNCLACCATGLDLSTAPQLRVTAPSTTYPEGQVQCGRDILFESDDDTLRMLAEWDEKKKYLTTYIPWLRKAQREVTAPDGTVVRYPIPQTLWPNVLLVNDRTSYNGVFQLFPRTGPLRSAIEARPGYWLISADWNQGELVTHGQSCEWIVGPGTSRLAQMVNEGADPHLGLAAYVLGETYEALVPRKKTDKHVVDVRQASKWFNFGKGGGMGVPKMVMTNRKQGPDTPCEDGPELIDDGRGGKVRGHKGLRFCVYMRGAKRCGRNPDGTSSMVHVWGRDDRPIDPTCRACLECAAEIERAYYKQWPEARPYFNYVGDVCENGQVLDDEQCDLHELPRGTRLPPGEMMMHVSGLIRGGVSYTDCSNGFFSSLLAVAMKIAFRQVQREFCDASYAPPPEVEPWDHDLGAPRARAWTGPSPLLGMGRAIGIMHDECFSEVSARDPARASAAAGRQSDVMVWALQLVCPDTRRAVKAPSAAMLRWLKNAEPRHDAAGLLVPHDCDAEYARRSAA